MYAFVECSYVLIGWCFCALGVFAFCACICVFDVCLARFALWRCQVWLFVWLVGHLFASLCICLVSFGMLVGWLIV